MAKYRNVAVKFWSDPFVSGLTPEKKFFFLYLLTNERTSQCGVYEITIDIMAFETGYNKETIEKLLVFFDAEGKIKWSKKTNEVAVKNFLKYNSQGSPKVKVYIEKEMKNVKNRSLIDFVKNLDSRTVKPIDTLSQQEQEQEQEQSKEQEQYTYASFGEFYKAIKEDEMWLDGLRLKEGMDLDDLLERVWNFGYADNRHTHYELKDWKSLVGRFIVNTKSVPKKNNLPDFI